MAVKAITIDVREIEGMPTADDEVASIYLRSTGKLIDKQAKTDEDGLLTTMWNYPLKGYCF